MHLFSFSTGVGKVVAAETVAFVFAVVSEEEEEDDDEEEEEGGEVEEFDVSMIAASSKPRLIASSARMAAGTINLHLSFCSENAKTPLLASWASCIDFQK